MYLKYIWCKQWNDSVSQYYLPASVVVGCDICLMISPAGAASVVKTGKAVRPFSVLSSVWADETVDCAVRWNRVNINFNVIDLAGDNLWNRHRLEPIRIGPTCCINLKQKNCQFLLSCV
jgi:hypothetical protein